MTRRTARELRKLIIDRSKLLHNCQLKQYGENFAGVGYEIFPVIELVHDDAGSLDGYIFNEMERAYTSECRDLYAHDLLGTLDIVREAIFKNEIDEGVPC